MLLSSPFRSVQRVYFDDLDALNILHNVRFLLFIERARGELFNALGFHWSDDLTKNPDKFNVIAEHSIRYLKPVRGEGDISVELSVPHLGRSSLQIAARVMSVHGSTCFADSMTRIVRLDPETFRPAPWSDRMREALKPLLTEGSAAGAEQEEA
jgi:acyl-CoA thioester hydrolase